jgi:hypothetical protein
MVTWRLTLTKVKAARQDNLVDCGIFVIINAIYLLALRQPPEHANALIWRQVFAAMLRPTDSTISSMSKTRSLEELKECHELLAVFKERTLAKIRRLDGYHDALNDEIVVQRNTLAAISRSSNHSHSVSIGKSCTNFITNLGVSLTAIGKEKQEAECAVQHLNNGLGWLSTELKDLHKVQDQAIEAQEVVTALEMEEAEQEAKLMAISKRKADAESELRLLQKRARIALVSGSGE